MALIGSNAVLVLDFSPILQHSRSATAPAKAFVAATVEVLGKHTTHDDCMARELQRKQLPLWVQATRLQRAELHVFVGRCVTPAVAKAGDILMRQQGNVCCFLGWVYIVLLALTATQNLQTSSCTGTNMYGWAAQLAGWCSCTMCITKFPRRHSPWCQTMRHTLVGSSNNTC